MAANTARKSPSGLSSKDTPLNETSTIPVRETANPRKNHFVRGSSPGQKKCIRMPVKNGATATMTPTLDAIV